MDAGDECTCDSTNDTVTLEERALKNHLILQNVASYSTINDLKTLREVNHHFKIAVTPELYRRSWCTLTFDEGNSTDLPRFIRYAQRFPVLRTLKKFKFDHMNLADKNIEKNRVIEFFERYGKTIQAIRFKRCTLDQCGEFWTNLVRISKWTSDLIDLTLEENNYVALETPPDDWGLPSRHHIKKLRFCSDKSDSGMPCVLSEFWKEFPVLESVQLVDMSEEENLAVLEAMNAGNTKYSKPMVLKHLDVFSEQDYSVREIPRNQLKLLCDLKLPLSKLTIDIGENILCGNFQQLLLSYGGTLKELIIWRGVLASKLKSPGFPFGVSLPQLKFLEIPESCILNFNFVHHVPCLCNLTIRQCDLNPVTCETELFQVRYSYGEWRAFTREPHFTLKELRVEFKISDENLEFLRAIFPNLRSFTGFSAQQLVSHVF